MRYLSICSGIEAATVACARCSAKKPVDAFHRNGQRGRHSWCKDCYNAWARDHRNRKISPEARVRNNLWSRYRLRPEDVEAMLADQNGLCALCGNEPTRPVIDHNHETGEARGVICHGCNIKLPAVEDSEFLAAALRYLGRKP